MDKKSIFWLLCLTTICVSGGLFYYNIPTDRPDSVDYKSVNTRVKCFVGGPDPYWKMVIAGAEDAASEFGAKLDVFIPESLETSREAQTSELSRISSANYDGAMLSPLDPEEQTRLISRTAAQMFVVTFDNEAPDAISHYHVGANNKLAGKLAAGLVQRALPEGGEIAIFVGDLTRQTARTRRQVLINSLAGQSLFEEVPDDPTAPIEAGKYSIVGTYLDDRNAELASANAKKVLEDHPTLKCMVGLYSKNGPACVEAVEASEKSSQVKVIAFDQLKETLNGIREGKIVGTVVQEPYSYGYESVRLLCDLHARKDSGGQSRFSGRLTVACRTIDSQNLNEYERELRQQLKQQ